MENNMINEVDNNEELIKARMFCSEVRELAKRYNLPFFVVTDGASATSNNGCAAIKSARNSHMEWERNNGENPEHDWSNEKAQAFFFRFAIKTCPIMKDKIKGGIWNGKNFIEIGFANKLEIGYWR